jgi:membrane protease YdiL (CAAX protease family)
MQLFSDCVRMLTESHHTSKKDKPLKKQNEMTIKTLTPFLAITFGLTWGLAALLFFFYDQIVAIFGEINMSNPLYIIAVYAPGFASVILVLKHYGFKGLGSFFKRFTLWRASKWGWLLIILGIPTVMFAGAAINGTLATTFPFSPWHQVFPALALALFLGPIEEFGWRGIALPLLQKRMAPFWAGLLLGVIWMLWHIPGFLISGTVQSGWAFAPFFVGGVASSLLMTAIFNDSRGSLLLPFLLHFQMNNPIWPNAQPWDNALLVVIALVVVLINRHKMFDRTAGINQVLFQESNR